MRTRRFRCTVLGLAVTTGVILAIAWPRAKLVSYVTPVLHAAGYHGKVTLLVPAGWEPVSAYGTRFSVLLAPHDTLGWLPSWVRRFFPAAPERSATLSISLVQGHTPSWPDDRINIWHPRPGHSVAYRAVGDGPACIVHYVRGANAKEFGSTYQSILNSIRLTDGGVDP
jgi:hypothetical protein